MLLFASSLPFLQLLSLFFPSVCPLSCWNNLSSLWLDARAFLLVPKTQSLRNLQIRWFCSDPFSSLAQTFAVNWSGGSGVQTELCGLDECHGKIFPSLFMSCFTSCYIFFVLTVWAVLLGMSLTSPSGAGGLVRRGKKLATTSRTDHVNYKCKW